MDNTSKCAISISLRALAFSLLFGCETLEELNYLKAVTSTIISTIDTGFNTGVKIDYVKLYDIIDQTMRDDFDPKMLEAIDQFKINIMDILESIED